MRTGIRRDGDAPRGGARKLSTAKIVNTVTVLWLRWGARTGVPDRAAVVASLPPPLRPAGSERLVAGRFHSVQCVNALPGASRSSSSSAKERVPRGGAVHRSGGDTFAPVHVKRLGICPPEWNAVLVTARTAARTCTAGI